MVSHRIPQLLWPDTPRTTRSNGYDIFIEIVFNNILNKFANSSPFSFFMNFHWIFIHEWKCCTHKFSNIIFYQIKLVKLRMCVKIVGKKKWKRERETRTHIRAHKEKGKEGNESAQKLMAMVGNRWRIEYAFLLRLSITIKWYVNECAMKIPKR